MLNRSKISELKSQQDGPVTIGGWVETLRDRSGSNSSSFVMSPAAFRYLSTPSEEDSLADQVSALTHGSFVIVKGQLKHDERVKLAVLRFCLKALRSSQHRYQTAQLPRTPLLTRGSTGALSTSEGQS